MKSILFISALSILLISCIGNSTNSETVVHELDLNIHTSQVSPLQVTQIQLTLIYADGFSLLDSVGTELKSGTAISLLIPCDTIAQSCSTTLYTNTSGTFLVEIIPFLSSNDSLNTINGKINTSGSLVVFDMSYIDFLDSTESYIDPAIRYKSIQLKNSCDTANADCLWDSRGGGQAYRTLAVGTQTWMAENLNYANEDGRYSFCYENIPYLCELYGRLYTWNGARDAVAGDSVQGVCPSGWHLPSDNEWKTLELALGMDSNFVDSLGFRGNIGSKLRNDLRFSNPKLEFEEDYNFSAIGGGYMEWFPANDSTAFGRINEGANFWTSTQDPNNSEQGLKRKIGLENDGVHRAGFWKKNAYSVRCVKNG